MIVADCGTLVAIIVRTSRQKIAKTNNQLDQLTFIEEYSILFK